MDKESHAMTHEEALRELGPHATLLTLELQAIRHALGFTQVQMAEVLGMNPRTYMRKEQGAYPMQESTIRLARIVLDQARRLARQRHLAQTSPEQRGRQSPHTEETRAKQRAARRAKRQEAAQDASITQETQP
jgi:transcriptional regulator with XRE-family HTH domain